MSETPEHGPRISGEEYDRRIVALYSDLPPEPSREQTLRARREELDLTVDHRLGKDFPDSRREALWEVHQRVQRAPLRLILKSALNRILPWDTARDARKLAGHAVEEYGRVLTHGELELFFGEDEVREPGLPVDAEEGK